MNEKEEKKVLDILIERATAEETTTDAAVEETVSKNELEYAEGENSYDDIGATEEDDDDNRTEETPPQTEEVINEETEVRMEDNSTATQRTSPTKKSKKIKEESKVSPEPSNPIEQFTDDQEDDDKVDFTLKNFMGGDIIAHVLKKQLLFVLMLTFMAIVYVTNRYACQTETIEKKRLTEKLEDRRLRAVVASSQLIEYTRRSNIQGNLKDSTLQPTKIPHHYIKIKSEQP